MKKGKLILAVGAVLMAFGLGACSNKSATDQGDKGDVLNLKFTFWGGPLEKKSIEDLMAKYNKTHKNVKVTTFNIPYENYMEKLNTQASTKTLPDLGYMMENNMYEWGNSGRLRDLSPLYAEGGDLANKVPESIFKFSGSDKIWGSSQSLGTITMYYNKEYFKKAGIEEPPYTTDTAWTWDEFVDVCKKLTVDRNGKHPDEAGFDSKNIKTYAVSGANGLAYESLLKSNGGGVVSDDGKEIQIGSQKSIDGLQKIQDLMYKDYVMPKPSQASTIPSTDTAMLTNRVVMSLTGSWDLNVLGEAVDQKGLKLGIGVIPKMGNEVKSMNYGSPIVVFNNDKTKKHWKEVKDVLEYILNPEQTLPIINSGLWQPNQEDWYTDSTKIKKWTNNSFSPEHEKEALVDTSHNNLTPNKAFYCKDATTIEQIVSPALEQIWTNKKSAKDAVNEDILPKLKKKLGDSYTYAQ